MFFKFIRLLLCSQVLDKTNSKMSFIQDRLALFFVPESRDVQLYNHHPTSFTLSWTNRQPGTNVSITNGLILI